MANRWGEMETVTDFLFLGSKITADSDYSHDYSDCSLLLGRKGMRNSDILKAETSLCNKDLSSKKSYSFSSIHVWMWELDHKEDQVLKNWCFQIARKDSWETLGLQGDQYSQAWRKSTLNTHWKEWCWSWSSNTLATRHEEVTHWKRPWKDPFPERLRAGGDKGDRGWDGLMASPTQWTWVWASSRR